MQITPKVAFIVFGVHKDGLLDPMGTPFINDASDRVGESGPARGQRRAGRARHDPGHQGRGAGVPEQFQKAETTWMPSSSSPAHGCGPRTWWPRCVTSPRPARGSCCGRTRGSQGWRPVGGLVMHGGLKEVGIPHRFVYGELRRPAYGRADRGVLPRQARWVNRLEHEHLRRGRWPRHGADVRRRRSVAVDAHLRCGHTRAEAVVSSVAASRPHPQPAQGERDIIHHHQKPSGRNLMPVQSRRHRGAAAVHVGQGFQQENRLLTHQAAGLQPGARARHPGRAVPASQFVGDPESHVVARPRIGGAGIPQAGDDDRIHQRSLLLFGVRFGCLGVRLGRLAPRFALLGLLPLADHFGLRGRLFGRRCDFGFLRRRSAA